MQNQFIYRISGKSPIVLWEVIRIQKKEKKLYKHRSRNKSFSSYSHFYVKKIVIYSSLGIFFNFFLNFQISNLNFKFEFLNLNFKFV